MKNSINFKNMSVVEINNENKEYLGKFKQGRNSNGNPRNAKFKITNAILKNDNYVIYRY
ncbi:hypothetical protein FACS1894166_11330 [Bacilli bacterium]|nr:hypothetical protein FACS1894166_11330 [Bacilli bacterium]